MKIGIYISGLGQLNDNNSVEKYAERLKNEMNFNTRYLQYQTKTEKINYTKDKESIIVSIYEKSSPSEIIYKFYDFRYHEILTEKFNGRSLIFKSFWLLLLVIGKFPLIIKRIFSPASYSRPFQLFYVFSIFLVLSFSLVLMIPAVLEIMTNTFKENHIDLLVLKNFIYKGDIPYLAIDCKNARFCLDIDKISKGIILFTALLVLIIPNANTIITNLATNFVCANDYLQHGSQRQLIQGNLEHLVDYVTEHENDCEIHLHTYSFGTILGLDYIYPYGIKASQNALKYCKAIITIGTPYEFVNSYYPKFYKNREVKPGDYLQWLNVYSIADALGTNFRRDSTIGAAEFGLENTLNKPININYEVSPLNKAFITDFIMLHSIRTHEMYWDPKTEGQSCLGLIYNEMKFRSLI
ncbi:hypothetical protein GCM10023210_34950 [Chryseobacterium ginsengisoli]|uniref:Alpha/beta hydrolase n=1 Tax=Chryseobacterium ginsengisoli TaxID=363853 RepID=A0ABP9MS31_9FLAO